MTTSQKRPDVPLIGDERTTLTGYLDHQRATVVMKAEGLTDEQARRSLVPSELTTIASLVSHLRLVEDYWFGVVLDGREDTWADRLAEDPDAEFRDGLAIPLARLIADYREQCAVSREIVARLDLDALAVTPHGTQVNVRSVLTHMIEETARHAGHLDILRELTDGSTGE